MDLDALRKAILEGSVGGAAIDVYPWEPEKNGDRFQTPLQDCPNVILTPHIGGSTEEAQQNIGEDVSVKLFNYLEKGITFGSHTVPALALPPQEGSHRILHIHNNVPGFCRPLIPSFPNTISILLASTLKPMMKLAMWCWM